MISKEEIKNLADLARLELTEEEVTSLQTDMSHILEYVGQLSSVSQGDTSTPGLSEVLPLPVLREDTPRAENDPLFGKRNTLLSAFPEREGDHLLVRKIIQKDE